MSYRPPQRPPKGRWALWLHQKRRDLDWSQVRAHEEFHEGLHFSLKSKAAYAAIDMGDRQPTDDEAAYLIGYFGEEPPAEEPTIAEDAGDLVTAIRDQTKAISDLVEELRLGRHEQANWNVGVQRVVESLAAQVRAQPTGRRGPRPLVGAER